jgi:hypothetical protein
VAGGGNGTEGAKEPSLSDLLAAVNSVATSVGDLSRRVDQVEAGGIRYVASEPEPKADARAVNPDALDPFTKRLWEERTRDTPRDYGGDQEPSYNIPQRLYLRNDGQYAWLQGDAKSRAYYIEKGFYCLNAEEVAEYEKLKPSIVAGQREKAELINSIVDLVTSDNSLSGHRDKGGGVKAEVDLMSADQLRELWRSLCAETTQPDRQLPKPKRFRSEGRDRNLDGVETNASTSMEEIEAKVGRARTTGRLVEVTPANARSMR